MRSKSSMKFLKRMLSIVVLCCIITQLFSLTAFATTELKGDVNGDGKVNVKDATAIQKHIADLITITAEGLVLADADGSGIVNIKDATAIQKHVAGLDTGFLIETPVSIKSATEDEVALVDKKILLY